MGHGGSARARAIAVSAIAAVGIFIHIVAAGTAPLAGAARSSGTSAAGHVIVVIVITVRGKIENGEYKFILGVKVPVTTLCPCSKEISDYGAHNQRAIVSVKISYPETEHIWIEDLIELIESCASCPLYSILKRQDEKYVTEHAWENPRFVEDVLREVVIKLRKEPKITEFEVDCEAFESIHNHSAWAYQKEVK